MAKRNCLFEKKLTALVEFAHGKETIVHFKQPRCFANKNSQMANSPQARQEESTLMAHKAALFDCFDVHNSVVSICTWQRNCPV